MLLTLLHAVNIQSIHDTLSMFSLQSDVPGAQYHIANLAACAQLLAPGAGPPRAGSPRSGEGRAKLQTALLAFLRVTRACRRSNSEHIDSERLLGQRLESGELAALGAAVSGHCALRACPPRGRAAPSAETAAAPDPPLVRPGCRQTVVRCRRRALPGGLVRAYRSSLRSRVPRRHTQTGFHTLSPEWF